MSCLSSIFNITIHIYQDLMFFYHTFPILTDLHRRQLSFFFGLGVPSLLDFLSLCRLPGRPCHLNLPVKHSESWGNFTIQMYLMISGLWLLVWSNEPYPNFLVEEEENEKVEGLWYCSIELCGFFAFWFKFHEKQSCVWP